MKRNYKILFALFLSLSIFPSCKKFVTVNPPQSQVVSSTVFNTNATATAAMTGVYGSMMNNSNFGSGGQFGVTFLCGFSADELTYYGSNADQRGFYQNGLVATNSFVNSGLWSPGYSYIYYANSIIEGLSGNTGVSDSLKQELTGEAKFIRAFCHLYLTELFGDIPLVISTNFQTNTALVRTPRNQVFQQIITDLKDAQGILSTDYSYSNGERIRPNKGIATALLARVYLYMGNWADALIQTSAVISNTSLYKLGSLNSAFLKASLGNSEAIWQLIPVTAGRNTNEGNAFILTTTPGLSALSSQVLNAFEPGDNRRLSWVGSITTNGKTYYFPYKYKVASGATISEYSMVLRLAEQYLIRAESEANGAGTGIGGAVSDLNIIRNRAGLPNYSGAMNKDSLLSAILHERQVELFTEWGHRWIDLNRMSKANAVMSIVTPLKGGAWNPDGHQLVFPIPQTQLTADPNATQNQGY
jgi:hypothetical protein